MKEIKLPNINAQDTMDIVRQIRAQGLAQHKDFDFAFHQVKYDPISGHAIENKHAIFKFYDDKYATLFALRYAAR